MAGVSARLGEDLGVLLAGKSIFRGWLIDGIVQGGLRSVVAGESGYEGRVVGMTASTGGEARRLVRGAHVVCRRRSKTTQSSSFVGREGVFQFRLFLREGWESASLAEGRFVRG